MNPCTKTSRVGITYMFPGGETRHQSIAVAANSRATVDVNDAVGPGKDVSIVVDSDLPLIAERPMYFNYQGQMAGGSTQFGATSPGTDWLFAEGTTRNNNADGRYDEYLCIQNPGGTPAGVTLTYMFTDGTTKQTRKMVVPNSRQTVSVNAEVGPDTDVSVRVTSDAPVVVERPMYYNYHGALPGGDVELGCKATARTWYFAEGTNRDGFEEWLTLLNPGAEPAEVNLTMMLEDGTTRQYSCTVAPTSRKTITVNGLLAL
jgi:hypothetical protein